MDPTRFDEITRSLGEARSRRGVFKTLGAVVVSAVGLAGLSRGAIAAPGGNSAAATFCHNLFGDTRAAGQCTSQAAHGWGPFYDCCGNPANYDTATGACNLNGDPGNCGGCGNVCQGDACNTATCDAGACQMTPLTAGTTCGNGGACDAGRCFRAAPCGGDSCSGGLTATSVTHLSLCEGGAIRARGHARPPPTARTSISAATSVGAATAASVSPAAQPSPVRSRGTSGEGTGRGVPPRFVSELVPTR